MKYLRWITGHPILSLLLITLVYGLINLSNLHHWLGQEDAAPAAEAIVEHGIAGNEGAPASAPGAEVTEVVVEKEVAAPTEAPAAVVEVVEVEKTVAVSSEPATAEAPVAEAPAVEVEAPAAVVTSETVEETAAPVEAPVAAEEAAAQVEAAQPAEEKPAAKEKSGGLFNKLFTGKAPEQAVAAATAEVATAAATAGQAIEEKGSSVLGFFKKDKGAGTAQEAAGEQAATAPKEEKGSLFGFFKRKEPAQDKMPAQETDQAKGEAEAAAPATEKAVESSEPAAAPAAVVAKEVTITMARQAFWNRDFAGATTMYEALIAKDPKNPDLYGEFGNMLIQSGKLPQGLESYEKAADLMIDQGRFNEVGSLIRFIGNYDRSKAMALVEKMPGH